MNKQRKIDAFFKKKPSPAKDPNQTKTNPKTKDSKPKNSDKNDNPKISRIEAITLSSDEEEVKKEVLPIPTFIIKGSYRR